MIGITPHCGVAFINHHGPNSVAIPMNVDEVETPAFLVEPSRGECNDRLVVGMVLIVNTPMGLCRCLLPQICSKLESPSWWW
ncbi:unnamed protein product [Linum tenue]|uniref:Uncharacterized protein n=1 Tax=Linum tenue TaxID=586396 RepID=A0AAV0MHL0_9ROSI|nr:unnamed protein product [Linum tenue]